MIIIVGCSPTPKHNKSSLLYAVSNAHTCISVKLNNHQTWLNTGGQLLRSNTTHPSRRGACSFQHAARLCSYLSLGLCRSRLAPVNPSARPQSLFLGLKLWCRIDPIDAVSNVSVLDVALAVYPLLKDEAHSFEGSEVQSLQTTNGQLVERGLEEATCIKEERRHHLSPTRDAVLSFLPRRFNNRSYLTEKIPANCLHCATAPTAIVTTTRSTSESLSAFKCTAVTGYGLTPFKLITGLCQLLPVSVEGQL